MKVTEVILFEDTRNLIDEKECIVQFIFTIIFISALTYIKLLFMRSLFADSEIGRDWSDIVNQFIPQRVFITKFNGQTGKLELFNCNQSCKKEMFKDQSLQKLQIQEYFNQYIQNFKLNINDCQIFKPPSNIADKNNMIDLKQYLVYRHLHLLEQLNNKSQITRITESSFQNTNGHQKSRQRANSGQSLIKNRRRRSSSVNKYEQLQVSFKDQKQNISKVFKLKIDQFGVSSSPQLILILDDESHIQEITRHKQEKSVLETFLFSLMKNVQEKLKYGIWGIENGFFDSVKVESYMLINSVYCILDYFIIKAKKLKGNFQSQLLNSKIQKILHVETFSWLTIMNELLDLFGDLTITSDKDLEQIYLTQDRRKLKQVLIALLSWSQYRAVEDYELKVSQIKKKEWNALLFTLTFQIDQNPKEFKKEFFKYLNGNQIELLNQIEEEVIKETVMLLGPYQISEQVTDDGIVQINFAFFEDLVVIYDSVKIGQATLPTQNNETEQDNLIGQKRTTKSVDGKISYEDHVIRMKERIDRRSIRQSNLIESNLKEEKFNTLEDNKNSFIQEEEFYLDSKNSPRRQHIEEIISINNDLNQQESVNSIEKAQEIPKGLSPKTMHQVGNNLESTQIQNHSNASSQKQISQVIDQTPNQLVLKKVISNISTDGQQTAQFVYNNNNNNNSMTNSKNIYVPKTYNHIEFDINNKMQSSIYNQHISSPKKNFQDIKLPKIESVLNNDIQKQNSTQMQVDKMNLNLFKQLSENKIEFQTPKRNQYHTPRNKMAGPQFTFQSQKSFKQFSKFKKNDSGNQSNHPETIQEQSNEQMVNNPTSIFQNINNQRNAENINDQNLFSFVPQNEEESQILPTLNLQTSKIGQTSQIANNHRNSIILFANQKGISKENINIQIKQKINKDQTTNIIKRGFADDIVKIEQNLDDQ